MASRVACLAPRRSFLRCCSSRVDTGSGRPLAELAADQKPLRVFVKLVFAGSMSYAVYDMAMKSDTLFVNSWVQLAKSRDAYNQSTGVSRLSRLRASDAALAEVVACGGVEPLVRALEHPQATTRLAALDLLANLPAERARAELVEHRATARADRCCRELEDAPLVEDAARCRTLAGALSAALAAGPS